MTAMALLASQGFDGPFDGPHPIRHHLCGVFGHLNAHRYELFLACRIGCQGYRHCPFHALHRGTDAGDGDAGRESLGFVSAAFCHGTFVVPGGRPPELSVSFYGCLFCPCRCRGPAVE